MPKLQTPEHELPVTTSNYRWCRCRPRFRPISSRFVVPIARRWIISEKRLGMLKQVHTASERIRPAPPAQRQRRSSRVLRVSSLQLKGCLQISGFVVHGSVLLHGCRWRAVYIGSPTFGFCSLGQDLQLRKTPSADGCPVYRSYTTRTF